jgi:arsenate reductase-like glutaredoxin family protein
MNNDLELQVIEIKPEKSNEEKLKELLEKCNIIEQKLIKKSKKTGT